MVYKARSVGDHLLSSPTAENTDYQHHSQREWIRRQVLVRVGG